MSSSRVKPGDVLGAKYKVEKVLGSGGMGIVVAARHIELNQRVALKFMLKEAMSDPAHAERFLREARAAVQLKSSHTAKVIDVGKLQNGEPYMVMEYLDGCDLDAELHKRGALSPLVAVDYIVQASEALAEAHALGIVHRDVKLKNLFLTKTIDGRPLVKVLDFGLAKTLGSAGDVSLTAVNSVFGSPQYMSPEQMRSAKDVDHRSDIWSLGVCLYELLTGRVPFDAPGVAEICAMVLKDPVPRPSQFAAGLPPELESVVMRCLEKSLDRRYQTVAEVVFALQAFSPDENSARRILSVVESASKIEHPTLVNVDPPAIDSNGKTLNAWDSGQAGGTRPSLSKGQIALVASLSLLMAVSGVGLGAVYLHRHSTRTPPVAITVPADPAPTAAATPPPPETVLAPAETTAPPTPPPTPAPTVAAPIITADPATTTLPPDPTPALAGKPRPATAAPRPTAARPATPKPASSSKTAKPGGGAEYM